MIAHKGLQGAPILEYPLHYKDNLTTIYVFMLLRYIRNHREYQNPRIRRILWNTAATYKIGTKALSAILDAMKLILSPPVDSCSECDPNDYSDLEESKADGLSCSPINVHVLIWHGFIDCAYLA